LETKNQQISGALPSQSNLIPSNGLVQESVKSITAIFEGQGPQSSKKSLGSEEGNFKVNGQHTILPMSEVSSDAILNKHWNQLGGPEVLSIQCIIEPHKVHYALYDWGATVNIKLKMIYDYQDEDPLVPFSWCL
jgi:hypothetical protein